MILPLIHASRERFRRYRMNANCRSAGWILVGDGDRRLDGGGLSVRELGES